jgi:hypothetical protein
LERLTGRRWQQADVDRMVDEVQSLGDQTGERRRPGAGCAGPEQGDERDDGEREVAPANVADVE